MFKIYESQRSVWEGGRNTKKLTKQKWRLESFRVVRFTHFKGDLSAEKRIGGSIEPKEKISISISRMYYHLHLWVTQFGQRSVAVVILLRFRVFMFLSLTMCIAQKGFADKTVNTSKQTASYTWTGCRSKAHKFAIKTSEFFSCKHWASRVHAR